MSTLNICVLIKAVYDPDRLVIGSDSKVDLDKTPKKINDPDRNAVEAALQIKEKFGGYVCGLTLGTDKSVLYEPIAMGLDNAYFILIDSYVLNINGYIKARILASAINKIESEIKRHFDLIILGEASLNNYSMQTGPRLSIELNRPFISRVSKILDINVNNRVISVMKDGTLNKIIYEARMPLIMSVTREINIPRYAPLLKIKRAMSFPIKQFTLADLGLNDIFKQSTISITSIQPMIIRRKGIVKPYSEDTIRELIEFLRGEGVL